jgi:hypothetical protein
MKKLLYLGFCLVLLAGFGCAITNYGVITDNDQIYKKKGLTVQPVIDTSGRAHIKETSQVATLWPDGSDELINFIDQKKDGTSKLFTYNNYSTGAQPIFHDDFYCNTAKTGCSIWTAPDTNDAADDPFDGEFNANCFGARSLSVLLSTDRYYGECGKRLMSLENKLNFLNSGILREELGSQGLLYHINSQTTSVTLDNGQGVQTNLPITGDATHWMSGTSNIAMLDLRNPLLGNFGRAYADWVGEYATGVSNVTICYTGICVDFTIAGNRGPSNRSHINANLNQHY